MPTEYPKTQEDFSKFIDACVAEYDMNFSGMSYLEYMDEIVKISREEVLKTNPMWVISLLHECNFNHCINKEDIKDDGNNQFSTRFCMLLAMCEMLDFCHNNKN